MNPNPREMGIGPDILDASKLTPGDCPTCGQQCSPECGLHPLGCVFGGFSYGYWLFDPECPLDHGVGKFPEDE